MVYRIGNIKDMGALPPMEEQTKELIYHYVRSLSMEYGEDRDVEYDGGYILYAELHTSIEEIKTCFDFTRYTAECVELHGDVCSAMYILNNDYVVTLLTRIEDTPIEIIKELD